VVLKELEIYSETPNHAVIRADDRRFPGSLVQGDSLNILYREAREISEYFRNLNLGEADILVLVQDHQEKLLGRLLHYQRVLSEHGIELPYGSRVSESDLVKLVSDEE